MKRNAHSLSHYRLATFNQGEIYPVACLEVLPGDSFRHDLAVLLRTTPLVNPVMHPVHVQCHSWYVPNRLLWDNWEAFATDDDYGTVIPQITLDSGSTAGCRRLASGLGIGIGADTTTSLAVNALPFRAYNLIWNEFYRDQDIDAKVTETTANTDTDANYVLLRSRWEKDYYTAARAAAELGGVASVSINFAETGASAQTVTLDRATALADAAVRVDQTGTAGAPITANFTVEQFRRAAALQKIREHRNRFGSRYVDYLRFLGVTPSDSRMSRPEYLGGGKQTISFSEVLSTAATTDADLGAMGGHGIAALRTRPYRRFFEEHGWVLSFLIVRPRAIYMSSTTRHWFYDTSFSMWQKENEGIGDQQILNREIYYPSGTPTAAFGYIPRFDHYRRHPSQVCGEFASTLDDWHLAREFGSQPVLNSSFLECTPTDRVYVETTSDELKAMIAHRIQARRLVSRKGSTERGAG